MTESQVPQQPTQTKERPPLPAAPALPFTLKANLTEYKKRIGVLRFVLAFIISLLLLRYGVVVWILGTIAAIVLIVGILKLLGSRKITVTNEGIEYVSTFRNVKKFTFAEISGVKVFFHYIEAGFGAAPRMIIGKVGGGSFISLTSLFWDLEEMDKLNAILKEKNVNVEGYEGIAVSQTIAKEFPDYVSYYEKHPYILATVVVLAIVVIVTVAVLLTM